jgi:hypothetical protein
MPLPSHVTPAVAAPPAPPPAVALRAFFCYHAQQQPQHQHKAGPVASLIKALAIKNERLATEQAVAAAEVSWSKANRTSPTTS